VISRIFKQPITWILLVLIIALAFLAASSRGTPPPTLSLYQFESSIKQGNVREVQISSSGNRIAASVKVDGKTDDYFVDTIREDIPRVIAELKDADVNYKVASDKSNMIGQVFITVFLPIILIFGLMIFVITKMAPGGGGISKFGKARTRTVAKDEPQTTFADVAGAQEAVHDLQEIKEFLASPARFQKFGAKIPKGVLLYGPPGTGKTLLARAVAGEAGVPFFSISGSDFVEMFVGVGASRVRDLFEQAKASAPAIIFVDEIDAVGRHRGSGMGGGHDEREQTLNQLLVEMDGFDGRTGVILIAATNRPDILDPALLRPGRFDRQIVIDNPDLEGRKDILAVHAKDKPLTKDVELSVIARRTPGFTGADLENILNEAALLAARRDAEEISMHDMEEAIDRVIAGPQKQTRVMSDHDKRVIAYHEGGHALVGHLMPDGDPVHKISIIARGRALGWTLALPTEDKYMHSRRELRARLASLMGGRTAEEIVFGEITTGASDDIEKATELARAMVTEYGMSDIIGPQRWGEKEKENFLGHGMGHNANYSDEVAALIDDEISNILDDSHQTARDILTKYRDNLERIANYLIENETVNQEKFVELVGDVPKWEPAHSRKSSKARTA
jgi:cell division protease FtsH